MEYLEKIIYNLTIYLIPGLFFLLGLFLAYWLWYKHSRRVKITLNENYKLQKEISELVASDTDGLRAKIQGKVQAVDQAWKSRYTAQGQQLDEQVKLISVKEVELQATKAESASLEQNFASFKGEHETKYNTLLSAKNALELTGAGSADSDLKVEELQAANERKVAEIQQNSQTITNQNLKIEELQEKLAASSTDSGSGSNTVALNAAAITPATYFAGSQASRHDRYGYVYEDSVRAGYSDNLTEIKGVDETLAPKLNDHGIYQFKQVALWNKDQIGAFQHDLNFQGRVDQEQWVNQAADLHRAKHGENLAPVVDIYRPAPEVASASDTPSGGSVEFTLEEFQGEDVRVDDDLGIIYNSRPIEVDDLKLIKGVASVLEAKLHEIGVYRFRQVASWDVDHMTEFSNRLAFPGRIERDNWKDQAKQFHQDKYGEVIS